MEQKIRTREQVLAEESRQPKRWWYVSFADEDRRLWLGGSVVFACGALHAVQETWKLAVNPGGSFMAVKIKNELVPSAEYHALLLNQNDLETMWGRTVKVGMRTGELVIEEEKDGTDGL